LAKNYDNGEPGIYEWARDRGNDSQHRRVNIEILGGDDRLVADDVPPAG